MVGGAWDSGGGAVAVYLYHPLCIVLEDMGLNMNYDGVLGPPRVSISNLILADIATGWCHPWHTLPDTPTANVWYFTTVHCENILGDWMIIFVEVYRHVVGSVYMGFFSAVVHCILTHLCLLGLSIYLIGWSILSLALIIYCTPQGK